MRGAEPESEARRRLDTRWDAEPHGDLSALPEGEGRAYIYGFTRGAEWASCAVLGTDEHDRKVAARALREAANDARADLRTDGGAIRNVPASVAAWLNARADRIAATDGGAS